MDYFHSTFDFIEDNKSTPQKSQYATLDESLSPIFSCSPSKDARPMANNVGDLVHDFILCFKSAMSQRLQTQIISYLLKMTIIQSDGMDFYNYVNVDFLPASLSAMKTLFTNSKHNLIYYLSKCFQDSNPRMPINRMPFGLLDYNIRFFAKGSTQNLGIEEHYASWLETMFSHFGHKWLCLHRGPAWQYDVDIQNTTESPLQGHENSTISEGTLEENDIIQIVLQEASLSLDDLNPSSETLENACCNSESQEPEDVVHVPHLWTRVSQSQQREIELGLVSLQEMEKFHRIQPTTSSGKQNPRMYNPLKVSLMLMIYFCL